VLRVDKRLRTLASQLFIFWKQFCPSVEKLYASLTTQPKVVRVQTVVTAERMGKFGGAT